MAYSHPDRRVNLTWQFLSTEMIMRKVKQDKKPTHVWKRKSKAQAEEIFTHTHTQTLLYVCIQVRMHIHWKLCNVITA